MKDVFRRTSLNKMMIQRLRRAGEFPEPIQLGPNTLGWNADDIEAWLVARTGEPLRQRKPGAGRKKGCIRAPNALADDETGAVIRHLTTADIAAARARVAAGVRLAAREAAEAAAIRILAEEGLDHLIPLVRNRPDEQGGAATA
jgi:prophage regulatory protein